jgi:hypothetical protein
MKLIQTILDFLLENSLGRSILAFIKSFIDKAKLNNPKLFLVIGSVTVALNTLLTFVATQDLTVFGINLSTNGLGVILFAQTIVGFILLLLNQAPKVTEVQATEVKSPAKPVKGSE